VQDREESAVVFKNMHLMFSQGVTLTALVDLPSAQKKVQGWSGGKGNK